MKAIKESGRRVPGDISVLGFDNIVLAQHVTPALTTMRIDKSGMGRMAAQLLFNRIEYPNAAVIKAIVRPQLIVRDSVTTHPRFPNEKRQLAMSQSRILIAILLLFLTLAACSNTDKPAQEKTELSTTIPTIRPTPTVIQPPAPGTLVVVPEAKRGLSAHIS